METYIGTEVIKAEPMDDISFLGEYRSEIVEATRESRPGYVMIYPDGYVSWSPEEVFERAYRLLTPGERKLIS